MDGITDEPPPLEDMSMFLQKMRLNAKPSARGWHFLKHAQLESTYDSRFTETKPKQNKGSLLDDSFSHPARIVESISDSHAEKLNSSNAEKESLKPLRRGFLNSAPEKKKKPPNDGKKKDIPFLTAKSKEKDIPDFMRVSSPVDQYRKELTRMLKPTQELVKDVMDNEGIKGGLEDPEIMAAVQDIANDPSAIHKYRNNPKITTFYSRLGKLMGDKIENQTRQVKEKGVCYNAHIDLT